MSATASLRPVRNGIGRSLLLLAVAHCGPLRAQILDWETAIAGVGSGNSDFTAVRARPADATGQAPSALMAGTFQGTFEMGVSPPPQLPAPLTNPQGRDGVVVRMDQDTANPARWVPVWYLQASSANGNVATTDLAVGEDGRFYATGRFSDDVVFTPGGPALTAPGFTSGFVAWGNPQLGTWEGAFEVSGMEPESIALGPGPNPKIYLTGPGSLARMYDPSGAEQWDVPVPPGTSAFTDIALSGDPAAPDLYVLTENATLPTGVVLHRLDRGNGTDPDNWQRRMGGVGNEFAGGLAVPVDGDPRLAFVTQDPNPNFGPDPLPGLPPISANHALMLRVDPAGNLVWSTPLGRAENPGDSMRPAAVDVDAFGNAFAAASFQGTFQIEGPAIEFGDNDAAILGVDATGILFDFHRSRGAGLENPHAIAAPVRDLVVTVGGYDAQPSSFGTHPLPPLNAGEPRGFFAAAVPIPGQQRLVLSPDPGAPTTVAEIIARVHDLAGQVYNEIRFSRGELAVAAFIDEEDIPQLQGDPTIILEPDHELRPSGTNSDAGWALEHLNDATNTSSAPFSFTYPEPGYSVFVYLLDTAVGSGIPAKQADIDTWFAGNTNLTLEPTTLVRGVGDPLVSSLFKHGTEMLSLIAGPATGAAVGTPLVLKNFDFYPTGASTTASLLASAIYKAIDYHAANGECFPGVIVIASSSVGVASSTTLSDAVDEAISEGIPVVLSAGNSSGDAGLYVPASKGSVGGVICVGASKADRTKETLSNFGTPAVNDPPVDLFAPGDSVRVIDYSAPLGGSYGSFTGTSASAALTGAVAATYLSVNPWSTPADLEAALTGDVYSNGASGLDILQLDASGPGFYLDYSDWAAWFGLSDISHAGDDDDDGWSNIWEYFHGLKPTKSDPMGVQTDISYDHSTAKYTFSFNISSVLLDPDKLGTLLDGTTYKVTDSTTLTGFSNSGASLTVGGSTGGQTGLSQTEPASSECYLRVEITPALPSP